MFLLSSISRTDSVSGFSFAWDLSANDVSRPFDGRRRHRCSSANDVAVVTNNPQRNVVSSAIVVSRRNHTSRASSVPFRDERSARLTDDFVDADDKTAVLRRDGVTSRPRLEYSLKYSFLIQLILAHIAVGESTDSSYEHGILVALR